MGWIFVIGEKWGLVIWWYRYNWVYLIAKIAQIKQNHWNSSWDGLESKSKFLGFPNWLYQTRPLEAAAAINFEGFLRPILLSKLKEGAATNKVRPMEVKGHDLNLSEHI